ncbi:MAG: ATP-binding protein, partial [Limisphaerales bacterium]
MRPKDYRCSQASDFIGDARRHALFIDKLVKIHNRDGSPMKLLLLGEPGTGKTELTNHLLTSLGVGKYERYKFSGADVGIDIVQEMARSFHLTTRDLFAPWRAIQIEEIDAMSNAAQIRMLALLDDLPRHCVVVGSSNRKVEQFETRFQSRFQVLPFTGVPADEIATLVRSCWPEIPAATVNHVATFC